MERVFNNWTFIKDLPKKNGKRYAIFKCVCGYSGPRYYHDIKSGHSKSCGCLRDSLASTRSKTHGDSSKRLYQCWCKMWKRSRDRGDSCNVYSGWSNYENFKRWSLKNGYNDKLQLCRNNDSGDYTPENARWDTLENNVKESKAKLYKFRNPEGLIVEIYNLSEFCRDNKLSVTGFHRLLNGQKSYKGYSLI